MTKNSLESPASLGEPDRAPPAGRALRVLLGLVLLGYVTPVYFRVPSRIAVGSLLLTLGLFGAYCLIQILVSRQIVPFNSFFGVVVATGLLAGLYAAGASKLPIFGRGKGELAAVTFLGISLVVAGVRAVAGCELMAIPSVFFRKRIELGCLIFSPLDRLERKLRIKHGFDRRSGSIWYQAHSCAA